MKKYEEANANGVAMALGSVATYEALARCGWENPILRVGKDAEWMAGAALRICEAHLFNFEYDDDLHGSEWYIEWNGKRFGSLGA